MRVTWSDHVVSFWRLVISGFRGVCLKSHMTWGGFPLYQGDHQSPCDIKPGCVLLMTSNDTLDYSKHINPESLNENRLFWKLSLHVTSSQNNLSSVSGVNKHIFRDFFLCLSVLTDSRVHFSSETSSETLTVTQNQKESKAKAPDCLWVQTHYSVCDHMRNMDAVSESEG